MLWVGALLYLQLLHRYDRLRIYCGGNSGSSCCPWSVTVEIIPAVHVGIVCQTICDDWNWQRTR